MATEALLAHVLVAKYADFLPLYRQAGIFARQGIELDRSTLCDWVGRACWWLEPLWHLLHRHVLGSTRIFADDTRLPVLDPGRGRTRSEEHTSELQSRQYLVCRLLLEKKKMQLYFSWH